MGFSIDSDLYQATPNKINELIEQANRGDKVYVTPGRYYNSVVLNFDKQKTMEDIKKAALAKLTPPERNALGV